MVLMIVGVIVTLVGVIVTLMGVIVALVGVPRIGGSGFGIVFDGID